MLSPRYGREPGIAGRVVHLELHTGDRSAAAVFYRDLFDLHLEGITVNGASYLAMDLGGGLGGGIVECGTHRPTWMPYVEVGDVAAATARALELGAAVLLEPREGPAGWRSVVVEPAGGEVGLWQPKPPPRFGSHVTSRPALT